MIVKVAEKGLIKWCLEWEQEMKFCAKFQIDLNCVLYVLFFVTESLSDWKVVIDYV